MKILFKRERGVFFIFLMMHYVLKFQAFAQCPPTISLSVTQAEIKIDNFAQLISGVEVDAVTYVNINAGCTWDLKATTVTPIPVVQYTAQGTVLPLANISIRAVNTCATPDQDYGLGTPPPPPRISGTFAAPLTGLVDNYMVGTAAVDGALAKSQAPCAATTINGVGDNLANPTTHRFRIDLKVIPGTAPVIRPGLYTLALTFHAVDNATGAEDIALLNFQIDIQPILQLKMTTPTQLDFIFDDIKKYAAGITQYGGTILTVNSSLNWDLMAVGTSSVNSVATPFWDNTVTYGTSGTTNIPLDVLELRQIPANPSASGAGVDYSPAFTSPPSGNNNIEVAFQAGAVLTFVAPYVGAKTIAGNWLNATGPPVNAMAPGSFQIPGMAWVPANFRYIIDYRLKPGLPAVFTGTAFPMALPAKSGAYTMQVRYILSEDQ